MASSSTPKVLIVGAGPSGLILALTLLRNGVSVRIIEKSVHPRIGQRGAGIMPRSMELLEALGIADQVAAQAIGIPLFRMYKMPEGVEILKEFEMQPNLESTPANPYVNACLLGQDNLDKIIRAELKKYGTTEVELGIELESLKQFGDHVEVKLLRHTPGTSQPDVEVSSYEYVVGADGAKSVVRKQLGLSFLGQTTEENFVVGDIKVEGLDSDRWHVWGEMTDIITSMRATETEGVFTFIIGGTKLENHEQVAATEESLKTFIKQQTGNRDDIKYGELICHGHYRPNIRMVEKFGEGRVYVTGDAGHIHSPAGGQGMNTGIQDSFNLGWKLGLVTKGLAPPSLLDTFSEERIPVVAEMLNLTTAILKTTLGAPFAEAGWKRTGNLNQLGVNYRWSSIVIDEEREKETGEAGTKGKVGSSYDVEAGGYVEAGDRAPDAPGLVKVGGRSGEGATRLFKLLDPTRHTVVIFADKVAGYKALLSIVKKYPTDLVRPVIITSAGKGSTIAPPDGDVFEDRDGHAYEAYKGPEDTSGIFVIRPDGVVGARLGSGDGLEAYFKGIFGDLV